MKTDIDSMEKLAKKTVEELRFKRGRRDGESGISPSDATEDYLNGYTEGRRALRDKAAVVRK